MSLLRDRWNPFPHRLWKPFFNNILLRSLNWQCIRQDKWWPSRSLPLHPCCKPIRWSCSRTTLRRKGRSSLQRCGAMCQETAVLLSSPTSRHRAGCCWLRDLQAAFRGLAGICILNLSVLDLFCPHSKAAVNNHSKNDEPLIHPFPVFHKVEQEKERDGRAWSQTCNWLGKGTSVHWGYPRDGQSVGNDSAPTVYQISQRSNKALMFHLIHTHLKNVSVWFWKLMQWAEFWGRIL